MYDITAQPLVNQVSDHVEMRVYTVDGVPFVTYTIFRFTINEEAKLPEEIDE